MPLMLRRRGGTAEPSDVIIRELSNSPYAFFIDTLKANHPSSSSSSSSAGGGGVEVYGNGAARGGQSNKYSK